jgi:formylglycine-generating enzyme required for sulfatase activity
MAGLTAWLLLTSGLSGCGDAGPLPLEPGSGDVADNDLTGDGGAVPDDPSTDPDPTDGDTDTADTDVADTDAAPTVDTDIEETDTDERDIADAEMSDIPDDAITDTDTDDTTNDVNPSDAPDAEVELDAGELTDADDAATDTSDPDAATDDDADLTPDTQTDVPNGSDAADVAPPDGDDETGTDAIDADESDAAADAEPDAESDAAADAEPDAESDAEGDVLSDVQDDVQPETDPDTTALNACGGELPLTLYDEPTNGQPGEPCSTPGCGPGEFVCDGPDAIFCVADAACNACDGLTSLAGVPGASCGACGDGRWACDGFDAVVCDGATAANACGGCGALGVEPGGACGVCSLGQLRCDGPDTVRCVEPDGASDALNACGGCAPLAGVPGTSCGECQVWSCAAGAVDCVAITTGPGCDGLARCSELDCADAGRTCVESDGVVDATCGGCLEGLVDAGDSCRAALDCSDLDCDGSNRACGDAAELGEDAICGACLAGYVELAGACVPTRDCGTLAPPASGSVATPDGTGTGARATYGCDAGRVLRGDVTRTCQPNGTWSGAPPVCNGLASRCSTDTDCPDRTWCPTDTYEHLRRCSPRPVIGGTALEMVYVPEGTFAQGSPEWEVPPGTASTRFRSTLSRPYFVGRTEVTNAQWREVMSAYNALRGTSVGLSPSYMAKIENCTSDDCAVDSVSWLDAVLFTNALSVLEGFDVCYALTTCGNAAAATAGAGCPPGSDICSATQTLCSPTEEIPHCTGYRLLTSAEYERAARGGTSTSFFWGEDEEDSESYVRWGFSFIRPNQTRVADLLPNGFGLYDMIGNVDEWTASAASANPTVPTTDFHVSSGRSRMTRGGSGFGYGPSSPPYAATAQTYEWQGRMADLGFRVARTAPLPAHAACSDIEWPADAVLSTLGFDVGALAIYGCEPGWVVAEPATQQRCLQSGEWSTPVPQCVPVDCGTPPDETDLTFDVGSTDLGSVVRYQCPDGEYPRGPNTRECARTGQWAGFLDGCTPSTMLCESDDDCSVGQWCPLTQYEGLRQCSPREFAGESVEMDFALVPAGTFIQGTPRSNDWDRQFQSTLTRDYWVSTTEVTQGQWKRATGGINPSCFQTPETSSCSTSNNNDLAPVDRVGWGSAALYANWLSAQAGLESCYVVTFSSCDLRVSAWAPGNYYCYYLDFTDLDCSGYRLLTEAEWERAARGGDQRTYVWGDSDDAEIATEYAWYDVSSEARTHPVGSLLPNPYGLFDLAGNVSEHVNDIVRAAEFNYDVDIFYPNMPQIDYLYLTPWEFPLRGIRGGAIESAISGLACSSRRDLGYGGTGLRAFGFRLARTVVR